jgi:hypothetical protein
MEEAPVVTAKRPQEEANSNGAAPTQNGDALHTDDEPASKRVKLDDDAPLASSGGDAPTVPRPRTKGVAPIKAE